MSKNLTFFKNLYIGEGINESKLDKLKVNLRKVPVLTKVFLVTISDNPDGQLDIIESKYLTYAYYNTHPLLVVGIAKTKSEAVGLIQKIVQDCLNKCADANIKKFLLKNNEETGD